MQGDQKQFYFLTADASPTLAVTSTAEVGISMIELTQWIRPDVMKAQKRILIFDACNSGQAIKDFAKFGTSQQQYTVARSDERSQQIKAIDKLNEQSGLFILAASASNQSAYEMGKYGQGMLTYALLSSIKQNHGILENGKFLDVSRWFDASKTIVSELTKENGARQTPQMVSNTNFNIGIVDSEVLAGIILPIEKAMFSTTNLQNNDEKIAADDLDLSQQINNKLANIATRGSSSQILFVPGNATDAYQINGRYEIIGNKVNVKANIWQNKKILFKIEVTGAKDLLDQLATSIANEAISVISEKK